MMNRFLVCPCTGDVPFTVGTLKEAADWVATDECYAISLNSFQLVELNDAGEWALAERIEDKY